MTMKKFPAKKMFALTAALLLAPALTACSLKDMMLYLYGGDDFTKTDEISYAQYDGENGVTVLYDANVWSIPGMVQEDTISITQGNQLDYTAVLLQVSDSYEDFLAQSAQELSAETETVEYEFSFTVPNAEVQAVRYDCGSYQTIFAVVEYDSGLTVYLTAATRSADYGKVTGLMQDVYPTGQTPESAAEIAAAASPAPVKAAAE